MAARGEQLARELELRIAHLKATIEPLTDDEWRLVCAGEGWPIGFVAYHISLGLERQAGWIERVTRAALDRRLGRLARIVRSLTEAQLDEMTLLFGEHQRSAEWIVRAVALRHIADHTKSIRATLTAHAEAAG